MGDLGALERVTVTLLRSCPSERELQAGLVKRWLAALNETEYLPPAAALESIVRKYGDLEVLVAQSIAHQARIYKETDRTVSDALWLELIDSHTSEENLLVEALFHLSRSAELIGETQRAIALYEQILERFSTDAEVRSRARHGISQLSLREARKQEEAALHEQASQIQKKRLEQARQSYRRLLQNDNELVLAHRHFIDLSAKLGKIDAVLKHYKKFARENPRSTISLYGYALALSYAGPSRLVEAYEASKKVLERDPRFPAAYITLGWIQTQRDRRKPGHGFLENAVVSYETASDLLASQPGQRGKGFSRELWAAAQLNKGHALFTLGKTDLAFEAFLQRELSGVAFHNAQTEYLFRESFARVALGMEHHDVALDMAHSAEKLAQERKGLRNLPVGRHQL